MQNMASRPQSLQDYLTDQLAFLDIAPDKMRLMRYVIAHIDDNGFLTVPDLSDLDYQRELRDDPDTARPHRRRCPTLAEMAAGYDHPVTPEQVEEALIMVQKLDPPGVGARDLKECLLLQVTPETPHRELVRLLILKHLEDIPHNRLPAIERSTGYDIPTIKEAIEVHQTPQPAAWQRVSPRRRFPTWCRISPSSATRTATTPCDCSTTGCRTSTSASAYIDLLQGQGQRPQDCASI